MPRSDPLIIDVTSHFVPLGKNAPFTPRVAGHPVMTRIRNEQWWSKTAELTAHAQTKIGISLATAISRGALKRR